MAHVLSLQKSDKSLLHFCVSVNPLQFLNMDVCAAVGSFLPSEGLIASHLEYVKLILLGISVTHVFPGSVPEPAVRAMFSNYTGSWPHVLHVRLPSPPAASGSRPP